MPGFYPDRGVAADAHAPTGVQPLIAVLGFDYTAHPISSRNAERPTHGIFEQTGPIPMYRALPEKRLLAAALLSDLT